MNRRTVILGLGLTITMWLTFFDSKEGQDEISQPVVRGKSGVAGKDSSGTSSNRSSAAASATVTARGVTRSASAGNNAANSASGNTNGSAGNAGSSGKNGSSGSPVAILALQDRADLLGQSAPIPEPKSVPKSAKGRPPVPDQLKPEPLFDSQTWNPPPPPPPKPTPPPPPVAPPLPYLVLGKKLEDQSWEVYLARGEQTFIAREKGTLENQYRVDSIKPPTMTLTYLPLNQVQTLTIGGTD